jgi:hypothetical protein
MEHKAPIELAFIGLRCTTVTRFSADSWRFDFEGRTVLDVSCPWRILSTAGIALGNVDHQQQFGLPTPIDAQQEAQKLLADRVVKATIREKTADLILELEQGSCLEVFNASSGYEGWECSSKDGLLAVARGGGKFETWNTDPPLV